MEQREIQLMDKRLVVVLTLVGRMKQPNVAEEILDAES